jgi:hypothetical protein
MANFTVVYDACVLYSASVRDLVVELALTGLLRAKWTARIHESAAFCRGDDRELRAQRIGGQRINPSEACQFIVTSGIGRLFFHRMTR